MSVTVDRARQVSGLAAALALALVQGAVAQSPPAVLLETVGSAGIVTEPAAVSADGRHVAFVSSLQLLPADTNSYVDVYVRDRVLGTLALVSATPDLVAGNGDSRYPSISADGRYVAFSSSARNLVGDDTNNVDDVFVHDRDSGENGVFDEPDDTRVDRVSLDTDGIEANCASGRPSLSTNGRFVAFDSCVTNWAVVGGKTFAVQDIFVHDRERFVTEWVNPATQNSVDGFNNHHSSNASISADGRYIAFASMATTQPQTLGHFGSPHVYVRDTCLGAPCDASTQWVSAQVPVEAQPSAASGPAISADGLWVAFESDSTALIPGDTNGTRDIFVANRLTGAVVRVNVSNAGEQAMTAGPSTCTGSMHASISGEGRFVAFASCANNLVADDLVAPNFQDVFVHDRDRDGNGLLDEGGGISTRLISRNPAGATANNASFSPVITSSQQLVVFTSFASDITPTANGVGVYAWTDANHPPTADAGDDQDVTAAGPEGATVTLDGTASSDPDGDALTYTWTGPFDTLSGATVSPTLGVGTHTITLTVDDGRGGTASDTVEVTVTLGEVIDLALTVTASPLSVDTGDDIRYDIAIVNQDVVDAHDVELRVAIPGHVSFDDASLPYGACVAPAQGTAGMVTCAVGGIAAGATASFTMALTPRNAGALALTFVVDGPHGDPTPADTQAVVTVTVRLGPAVISIVEAIVVSDAAAMMPSALVGVSESIAVQDTPGLLPAALVGITESITVADTAGVQPAAMLSVVENVTVADTPVVALADRTPPVLTLPAGLVATATSAAGAVVSYVVSATDLVDGVVVPVCAPASGSTFAIGVTTVSCAASDSQGNTANGSFTVQVVVGIPWIGSALSRSGRDAQGRFFVDITMTNGGTGHARDVRLTTLNFFTLAGNGSVTYDAAASGVLPVTIGSLNVREAVTVRLYLRVPRTVRRFLAVQIGSLETVTGLRLPVLAAQVIDPR
jgi:Tol biopolymer transport system component